MIYKFYLENEMLDKLTKLKFEDKILSKNDSGWSCDPNGNLCIAYQTIDKHSYNARSFEDAFISINHEFLRSNIEKFSSLKNIKIIEKDPHCAYEIADKCIVKKSIFASEILYLSEKNYSNWDIPDYIKEGLVWLAK